MRIFLIGYMGSGKSSFGKKLAKKLGLSFTDLDNEIEKRAGKTISEIFAQEGEEAFRKIENECLNNSLDYDHVVLSAGGGTPCFFDNLEKMNQHGTTIYLRMDSAMLVNRLVNAKKERPLVAAKSKEELMGYVKWQLYKREAFYLRAKYTINIAKYKVDDVIRICGLE